VGPKPSDTFRIVASSRRRIRDFGFRDPRCAGSGVRGSVPNRDPSKFLTVLRDLCRQGANEAGWRRQECVRYRLAPRGCVAAMAPMLCQLARSVELHQAVSPLRRDSEGENRGSNGSVRAAAAAAAMAPLLCQLPTRSGSSHNRSGIHERPSGIHAASLRSRCARGSATAGCRPSLATISERHDMMKFEDAAETWRSRVAGWTGAAGGFEISESCRRRRRIGPSPLREARRAIRVPDCAVRLRGTRCRKRSLPLASQCCEISSEPPGC
jgi:hypothetical protein